MVGDGGEGALAEVGVERDGLGGCGRVGVPDFNGLIGGARDELLFRCPAHALDNIVVCFSLPELVSAWNIPHLDDSISAATGKSVERAGGLWP